MRRYIRGIHGRAPRGALRATFIALAATLLLAGTALADSPTKGYTKYNDFDPNQVLTFQWGASGYPSWVGDMVTQAAADFVDRDYNNSRLPTFKHAAGSTGTIYYLGATASPCSGNTAWIQCSRGWGDPDGWKIYLRDFSKAPMTTTGGTKARWINQTDTCPSGYTCWDAQRAFLHEWLHVTMGVLNHDEQGEALTLMAAETPSYLEYGGHSKHIKPCDEAAGQLLWDLADKAGEYSACLKDIPGTVTAGLVSVATVAGSSFVGCVSTQETVTGTLEIKDVASYSVLGGNALAGRTVSFDRRLAGATTWVAHGSTTAVNDATTSWSKSFSGAVGTYEYRVRFAGDQSVAASNSPTFKITWRTTPCPI